MVEDGNHLLICDGTKHGIVVHFIKRKQQR
jgi:hypothetical protein